MPARFARARQLLLDAVGARVAPCAVAEVGTVAGRAWRDAAGSLTYDAVSPAATPWTVFDLASLTKVIATTTLAMRMVEAGRLGLAEPACEYLKAWRAADRRSVTVADLLEHASGLPAVLPLHETCAGRAEFEAAICGAPLAYAPRTRSIYSDPGFILLGFILEDAAGASLRALFDDLVRDARFASPPDRLEYGPLAERTGADFDAVAPTQFDSWRGRLLRGEVDDRNGAALGGVAGHTGLFGTVGAVGRFARAMLAGARGDEAVGPLVASAETIARFLAPSAVPGSSRALGWDTMRPASSCGTRMSSQAFGHTGFTGTSLWIDPGAGLYVVLLTNRVHPEAGSSDGIQALRRALHDAVLEDWEGDPGGPPRSQGSLEEA
jgi:CubicO group peptidase (beta-lactamase class C family)